MSPVAFLRSISIALLLVIPSQSLAESPSARLADGKPWASVSPDGRKMSITFYPDGKAKMKMGLFGKNLTWRATEDGICLIGTPRGDACMRLEPVANGYIGFRGDERVMTLSR